MSDIWNSLQKKTGSSDNHNQPQFNLVNSNTQQNTSSQSNNSSNNLKNNSNYSNNSLNYSNTNPNYLNLQGSQLTNEKIIGFVLAGLGVSLAFYLSKQYVVSQPNQILAKTGLLIADVHISKKTIVLPFQRCTILDLRPSTYHLNLTVMSEEKMEFVLPLNFTIGVKDEKDHLERYAKYTLCDDTDRIEELVKGIIEGETRVQAACMKIETIFGDRTEFKLQIQENIQNELSKMGLWIYNANIKELQDGPNSKYFKSLALKTSSEAQAKSNIDIAEAQKVGTIGQKVREAQTRQEIIQIESQTKIKENDKQQEIQQSEANLKSKIAELDKQVRISQIESEKAQEIRNETLQKVILFNLNFLNIQSFSFKYF